MKSHYNNILLVEDDLDDREFFLEALKNIDQDVVCTVAENGYNALHLLQTNPQLPDLIFLDLNLPLMNGFEFLTLIKKDPRFMNIPVVIFATTIYTVEKFYELGALVYLTKPSSPKLFHSTIAEVLTRDVVKQAMELRSMFPPSN